MEGGIVTTVNGAVSGVRLDGRHSDVTLYRGVPYAAPPLGPLRWAPPAPALSWEGVRVCDTDGPAAYQALPSDRHAREYYYAGSPELSEDCLYLTVATAATEPGERRPVYVYFHGGGLTNCYPYEVELNPAELARKGVVVVSVGQRLGVFGHLALPQLTAEQGSSGNWGLLDEIAALDWIRDNIEGFGGDPERITVGGQSGGAIKATVLAIAEPTRDRVRGVISQSGNKWAHRFTPQAEAEAIGRRYLQHAGLDPDASLETLRGLPTEQIFADSPKGVTPDHLVPDGVVLHYATMAAGLAEHAAGKRFVNGNNLGETHVFSASTVTGRAPTEGAPGPVDTVDAFRSHFRALLGDRYDAFDFESAVPASDAEAREATRRLSSLGLAGYEFNNSARSTALNLLTGELLARQEECVSYTYLWSHLLPWPPGDRDPDRDPDLVGAWHSSELWFAFGSLAEGVPPFREWRPVDYALADRMTDYFARFIATGDPNGEGLPVWTPSDGRRGWMEFTDDAEPHTGLGDLEPVIVDFTRAEYGIED